MTGAAARPVTPVGILAARLRALVDGPALPPELHAELAHLAELAAGLESYPTQLSAPEPAHLAGVAELTRGHDWSAPRESSVPLLEQEMLSGHLEGRFLALLVRAVGARQVLEIGTFTGYATLAIADALPSDGYVVTCEADADAAGIAACAFAAHPADIRLRVGPAADTLAELAAGGESFDLVFLDADKAGYAGYVDTLLDTSLLAPDGLLCVDNTLMQGQPWAGPDTDNGRAIAQFNTRLAADPRVEQVVVPLRDGVTLALRRR